jgi:hypothetical protein
MPITAHPVIIFYDLMEEANGRASACGSPTLANSEDADPKSPGRD